MEIKQVREVVHWKRTGEKKPICYYVFEKGNKPMPGPVLDWASFKRFAQSSEDKDDRDVCACCFANFFYGLGLPEKKIRELMNPYIHPYGWER